ncbi:MAG TPA: malto-oligosyltrehalose trehalohydrolase [Thermoanaerobaculia bacterium]|nr:malto-oligosyltrehalose trehalohydrolase [Thermoanaerobaculia bacterium]
MFDDGEHDLAGEDDGYFSALVPGVKRYRLRLDGERETYPDPASRFQPEGPHGPSQVVDASAYRWKHAARDVRADVIYEMHIGTFTREGTFAAAIEHLPALADIGITMLEVMPIHEFPGAFGWGYDGVDLWAPSHLYGEPDDVRAFVDAAHGAGLSVILDVVYNHFGPDGNYIAQFAPSFFSTTYTNEWGDAINFEGDDASGVREFFAENAAYWIDEFHFDGLRFDATQSIHDRSATHILGEIAARARAAAGEHKIFLVAEDERQDVRHITEHGLDALWNDDWHHASRVALGGRIEAYYTDYRGRAQEFVSMAKHGFLYQGQRYKWQRMRRGTPSIGIAPRKFICCLENHDQVANSAHGERLTQLASRGRMRAMTALLLLQPATPMLFQGQELGLPTPFQYFADHKPELATLVANGRREFLTQFPSLVNIEPAPPHDRATFEACKLDRTKIDASIAQLYRELLQLRRDEELIDGAVLSDECFLLRWPSRLLIINLGEALHLDPAPEPLLAPPAGSARWALLWSSEPVAYEIDSEENWRIPRECALLLAI